MFRFVYSFPLLRRILHPDHFGRYATDYGIVRYILGNYSTCSYNSILTDGHQKLYKDAVAFPL